MPEIRTASSPRPLRGDPNAVSQLLQLPGALLHGHFKLLSGAHTDRFFAFSTVARRDGALDDISGWLAPHVEPLGAQMVIAPTTAGVGLGWTLATHLGIPLHLATLDDEGRATGILGEPDLVGKQVLLVNDVVTTGHGLTALSAAVTDRGGHPCGACWFLTRSPVDVTRMLGVPSFAVAEWDLPAAPAAECPQCADGDVAERALDLN